MKRIISIILCMALVLSILPVNVSAAGKDTESLINVGDEANEMMNNAADPMNGLANGVSRLSADLSNGLQVQQQLDFFTGLMNGIKIINMGLGLVNGTVSFLKLLGVIKDPQQQMFEMLENIYDVVLDIQETVDEIDQRTEDIQKSLITEAAQTSYDFRLNRYDSFRQEWNTFFDSNGPVNTLNGLMNEYQSEVNKKMIAYTESWQEKTGGPVRTLYSDSGMAIYSGKNMDGSSAVLPQEPLFADNTCTVCSSAILPAEYITVEKSYIGVNSYLSLLQKAIEEGTAKAMEEKAIVFSDESVYESYEELGEAEKAEMVTQLARDFLDSVAYEAAYETANTSYKGVGTFANAVNSAYTAFSNTIFGANGVTSPLESGLSKLAYTHGFEGEIKEEAAIICTYLSTLGVAYGEFDAFLASMDRGLWESKEDLIKRTIDTAYYPICYHDCFITGYDNYCYPLNAVVGYDMVAFEGTYTSVYVGAAGSTKFPVGLDWEIHSYVPNITSEDAKEIISSNSFLSKQDMALLYLYYQEAASRDSGIKEFNDYIGSTGIMPPNEYEVSFVFFGKKYTSTITVQEPSSYLTSAPTCNDLKGKTAAGSYRTKGATWDEAVMWGDHQDRSYHFAAGELNYKDISEDIVYGHDRLIADTFDVSPYAGSLDSRLHNETTLAERACGVVDLDTKSLRNLIDSAASATVFADPKSHITYDYHPEKGAESRFTVVSPNYGMLYYSSVQPRGNDNTGSVFAVSDWLMIGGCTVVLSGGIVAAALISRKRKKEEVTE